MNNDGHKKGAVDKPQKPKPSMIKVDHPKIKIGNKITENSNATYVWEPQYEGVSTKDQIERYS